MIKNIFKASFLTTLLYSSLYCASDYVPIYNIFKNLTYEDSKNSITAGANTATAKGYAALGSNPAGLSTNYNATVYLKTLVAGDITNSDGVTKDIETGKFALGAIYDSYAVEVAPDNYLLFGAAYGRESIYGLFSIGFSYKSDQTKLGDVDQTQGDNIDKIESATGDYLTYGLMWQKTFLTGEDFYAFYFGYSYKNSGLNTSNKDVNLPYRSASRRNIGLGFETNVYDTTILFTLDFANEFFQTADTQGKKPSASSTAIGVKWMIGHKFAIGLGQNSQTFSDSLITDIQTSGLGIEYGIWDFHIMPSFTNRITNTKDGEYSQENAAHIDLAYTF